MTDKEVEHVMKLKLSEGNSQKITTQVWTTTIRFNYMLNEKKMYKYISHSFPTYHLYHLKSYLHLTLIYLNIISWIDFQEIILKFGYQEYIPGSP